MPVAWVRIAFTLEENPEEACRFVLHQTRIGRRRFFLRHATALKVLIFRLRHLTPKMDIEAARFRLLVTTSFPVI